MSADARTLKSDQTRRDGAVRGLLAHMPVVVFRLQDPLRLPTLSNRRVFGLGVPGMLRLHGVERDVMFPVQARWTSDRLEVVGSLRIAFADYRIKRPKIGPVLSVSEHARIEVQLSFAHS